MTGQYQSALVVSTAGRDCGNMCIVLREEEDFLWIADGRTHPVGSPKRKKRKHVRLMTDVHGEPIRFDGNAPTDRVLRGWLRECAGRIET